MTDSVEEPRLPSPKERRRLREAVGLTCEEVALAVGVTAATLRSWEAGLAHPRRGRKRDLYARLLTGTHPAPAHPHPAPSADPPAPPPQEHATGADGTASYRQAPEVGGPAVAGQEWSPPGGAQPYGWASEGDTPAGTPTVGGAPFAGAAGASVGNGAWPEGVGWAEGSGPRGAFDALYRHAAPALARQVYLLTGAHPLALEAVERAFQQAWARWPEAVCV